MYSVSQCKKHKLKWYLSVHNSDTEDWFCECPPLYTGRLCQLSTCERGPCSHGATCIPKSQLEPICLCPYGRQGLLCDQSRWWTWNTLSQNSAVWLKQIQIQYELYLQAVGGWKPWAVGIISLCCWIKSINETEVCWEGRNVLLQHRSQIIKLMATLLNILKD